MAERNLTEVGELFADAPLTDGGWPIALDALARVTGGWSGEMLWFAGADLVANVGGGIATEVLQEFEDRGGSNAAVNPRIAAALMAPTMRPVTEPEFISADARERHPLYQEFFSRVGADFASFARLNTRTGIAAFIVVLRSRTQSWAQTEQTEKFEALLPVISRAVETQRAIDERGIDTALDAFSALNMAIVFCDRHGRILNVSPAAELFFSVQNMFRSSAGTLAAVDANANRRLQEALRKACVTPPTLEPRSTALALRSATGGVYLVEVTPMPRSRDQPFAGAEILVLINPRMAAPPADLMMQLGLTEAEAALALTLETGVSLLEAAKRRGVTRNTVHNQLKSIFGKLDIRRQSELAALVARLR
jgi:DNA-binding CsgD family transcriptional regulator/PAS domain-containing protein